MRWKPFNGGVPYTCQECPALREANEEIKRLQEDNKNLRMNNDTLKTVIQFMENGDEVYRLD